jgi:hypothetical protein
MFEVSEEVAFLDLGSRLERLAQELDHAQVGLTAS